MKGRPATTPCGENAEATVVKRMSNKAVAVAMVAVIAAVMELIKYNTSCKVIIVREFQSVSTCMYVVRNPWAENL
jgi:hypothetical protein